VSDPHKHGNVPSDSIKGRDFSKYLSVCWIQEGSDPWRWLFRLLQASPKLGRMQGHYGYL
jgi:hypothetical protein